jgi:hypothetical protein
VARVGFQLYFLLWMQQCTPSAFGSGPGGTARHKTLETGRSPAALTWITKTLTIAPEEGWSHDWFTANSCENRFPRAAWGRKVSPASPLSFCPTSTRGEGATSGAEAGRNWLGAGEVGKTVRAGVGGRKHDAEEKTQSFRGLTTFWPKVLGRHSGISAQSTRVCFPL